MRAKSLFLYIYTFSVGDRGICSYRYKMPTLPLMFDSFRFPHVQGEVPAITFARPIFGQK